MNENIDKQAIRDAATIVLLRRDAGRTRILMGQRGARAAFMPNKYVFPGGAVDAEDYTPEAAAFASRQQADLLAHHAQEGLATALAHAAIRELWEESGLMLGAAQARRDQADPFHINGYRPRTEALTFFFRAVTPPGRPRRFDARFFMAEATSVMGDLDDFSAASDELSHLHWVDLDEAISLELPFITELVLSEVKDILGNPQAPRDVPFFNHDHNGPSFRLIRAESP